MLISEQITQAISAKTQLTIRANNTTNSSNIIDLSAHSGIVNYHPEELVITIKAGTKIKDLINILAQNNQALGFNTSAGNSTIGGAYATGGGLLRDFVLGVKIIDGRGNILNFGGQVMKNVAGYDVSRLLVGSAGKLAVISEVSFKILPSSYIKFISPDRAKLDNSKLTTKPHKKIEQGLKQVFDPYNIFI